MRDLATLVNQFAYPVALKKITWKTYIVFVIWCPIQALVIYFFIPETKVARQAFPIRTGERQKLMFVFVTQLEELDDIFNAKNPRKASLEKKKVELDDHANITHVEKLDQI